MLQTIPVLQPGQVSSSGHTLGTARHSSPTGEDPGLNLQVELTSY